MRKRCRPDFTLGVRLSPERFGLKLAEMRYLAGELMQSGDLDFLDMSLWDVFKEPVEEDMQGKRLMAYFTELNRGTTKLGVAGKITSGDDAAKVLEDGADFAIIGRGAVLHHDFPRRVAADPHFKTVALPVTRAYLAAEGAEPEIHHLHAELEGLRRRRTGGRGGFLDLTQIFSLAFSGQGILTRPWASGVCPCKRSRRSCGSTATPKRR